MNQPEKNRSTKSSLFVTEFTEPGTGTETECIVVDKSDCNEVPLAAVFIWPEFDVKVSIHDCPNMTVLFRFRSVCVNRFL